MNKFERYLALFPFWKRRSEFYRDVATSIEERELPRDFIEGEYQIATTPATADKTKAKALGYMKVLMESGVTSLQDLLRQTMPPSDSMGIAVIEDARDKAAALRYVAENVDQQTAMNKVVTSALMSPLILLPIAMVFSFVMAGYVIPAFEKTAPPEVWTGFAAMVRNFAELFRVWAPWVIAGAAGILDVLLGPGKPDRQLALQGRKCHRLVQGSLVAAGADSADLLPLSRHPKRAHALQPVDLVARQPESARRIERIGQQRHALDASPFVDGDRDPANEPG
jgi:hypothetical protein